MSTVPPACATTSQIRRAFVAGFGSTCVQVTPASSLTATPHVVPTITVSGSSGTIPIPNAEGSSHDAHEGLVSGTVGCVHVWPASWLTLMPESGSARPSKSEVA